MTTRHDPRTRHAAPHEDPDHSDHGAWDAPTVQEAPHDAVRGGISTAARGIGSGLGAAVSAVVRTGSALGRGLSGSTRDRG